MIEYDTADWNKRLSMEGFSDLLHSNFEGWDLDTTGRPFVVSIDFIWPQDGNPQREIETWVDDNSEGYFYEAGVVTESGTAIVRPGDQFVLKLAFQCKDDAVACKLRWM